MLYDIRFVDEIGRGDKAREVRRGDLGFAPMTLHDAEVILPKLTTHQWGRVSRRYVIHEVV